jgi:REP-associated tyrosine transposase
MRKECDACVPSRAGHWRTRDRRGTVAVMSNRIRLDVGGTTHHVNIKAVAGVHAFPDDHHRERFLELLRAELTKSKWRCLGYTVMGTHYHVVIELREPTLSSGFQRLNSSYSRWFNRERGRTGALWQARFFDVPIESTIQFLETQRYLAHNATRARLVENPEDWQYCHYGALIGKFPADELVDENAILRLLGPDRRVARQRLRAFAEASDRRLRRQTFVRACSDGAWRVAATTGA